MTNRELINSVNVSLRFNMGKAVITLFLIYILTVFLSTTVITVSLLSTAMIIPVVFGFVLCSIFVMLYLGYAILLAKLYSGKRAVIGDIFFPFRHFSNCGSYAVLLFIVFFIIFSLVFGGGISLWLTHTIPASAENVTPEFILLKVLDIVPLLSFVSVCLFTVFFLLPHFFVHLVILDNSAITLKEAFKENKTLLKKKHLKLLGFLIMVGGKWLLCTVIALCVTSIGRVILMFELINMDKSGISLLMVIMQFFDIVYFICSYTSIIRILTGVAAFYDNCKKSEEGIESILIESDRGE